MKRNVCMVVCLVMAFVAVVMLSTAATFPNVNRKAYYSSNMPATLTTVVTGDAVIDGMTVTTGSTAATFTVQDISTDCNTGACKWFDTAAMDANQTWTVPVPVGGMPMPGGFKVQASGANLISVKITYRH